MSTRSYGINGGGDGFEREKWQAEMQERQRREELEQR